MADERDAQAAATGGGRLVAERARKLSGQSFRPPPSCQRRKFEEARVRRLARGEEPHPVEMVADGPS